MRPALKMGIYFAGGWMIVKFIFLSFNIFQDGILIPGLINNLFLLLSISVGLFLEKKKEGYGKGTPLSDIKAGLVAGVPYIVLVSGFMFFYYSSIHPQYIENKVEQRMDAVYHQMKNPAYLDSIRAKNDDFRGLSKDDILHKIKKNTEATLSPKALFVFSLLGLLLMSVTYAIFVTLVFQKVLFRDFYPKIPPRKR